MQYMCPKSVRPVRHFALCCTSYISYFKCFALRLSLESALRVAVATLRRLLVARERRLEVDLQTKLAVLVGLCESVLRPKVATFCRLVIQGPSPS